MQAGVHPNFNLNPEPNMRTRPNLTNAIALLSVLVLSAIYSCSKERSQIGTDEQEELVSRTSTEADAEAETLYNEFFDDVMGVNNDVGVSGSGIFYGRTDSLNPVPRCFTVTVERLTPDPFPVKVTIDFGTTGCPGPDGRVRKGKMITIYSNRLTVPGAVATTTFERFFVDNVNVQGTYKVSNITIPPIRKFKVEVINGKLLQPNGNYVEWNSVRTVTQIEGNGTPEMPRDDVFKIEGSANGVVKRDSLLVRWESTIVEPLIRRFTCRWIVKGTVKAIRANLPPGSTRWIGVLDFGTGACDNQATLTVNGISRQITLP